MTRRYDLYGFEDLDLEQARSFVETALGIQFQPRDSSYRGGLYYRVAGDDWKSRFVLERDETSTRFPEYRVRLSVNDIPDMDLVRDKLTSGSGKAVLLTSKTIDDDRES